MKELGVEEHNLDTQVTNDSPMRVAPPWYLFHR